MNYNDEQRNVDLSLARRFSAALIATVLAGTFFAIPPANSAGKSSAQLRKEKAALEKLFSSQVTPSFLSLLKLLADRQRIGLLNSVLERLLEIYREQRNIALATITSASALNEDQQSELLKKVQSIAGTDNLEIDLKVDSELLGGFVVNVGSKVIDASIAGQVRRLGLALAKVS